MNTQSIKLSDIVTTRGTQIRAKIDAEAVGEYADAMTDGAKFPPVVVFHDGIDYVLADGFHRVMAASRNGFKDILAEIHKGTKADALKFALGANTTHGIKRTNADKRRSVVLALAQWPKLSDRELAKICAVSDHFVGSVRKESTANESQLKEPATRIGRDGKERKLPKQNKSIEDTYGPEVTPEAAPGNISHEQAQNIVAAFEAEEAKESASKSKRQLSREESEVIDALDLCAADIGCIRECIASGDCDPATINEVAMNFSVTVKKLQRFAKAISA